MKWADLILATTIASVAVNASPQLTVFDSATISNADPFLSPRIVTDERGNWVAAWADSDGIKTSYSTDNGDTWSPPFRLRSGHSPFVATDSRGNWFVVFVASAATNSNPRETDLWICRSTNNGATWSAATLFNHNAMSDTGNDENPEMATDGRENWVIVWQSNDALNGIVGGDDDIFISYSTDNLATWTVPAVLNSYAAVDSNADDTFPQVATDEIGNWIVAWETEWSLDPDLPFSHDSDIGGSRSSDNGVNWSEAFYIAGNPPNISEEFDRLGNEFLGDLASDHNGTWLAVFTDYSSSNGGSAVVRVSRSSDMGRNWSEHDVSVHTLPFSYGSRLAPPQIATDRTGNWLVSWDRSTVYSSNVVIGLFVVVKQDNFVAWSSDEGESWSDPIPLAQDQIDISYSADVASNGAGNWVALWNHGVSYISTLRGVVATPMFLEPVPSEGEGEGEGEGQGMPHGCSATPGNKPSSATNFCVLVFACAALCALRRDNRAN